MSVRMNNYGLSLRQWNIMEFLWKHKRPMRFRELLYVITNNEPTVNAPSSALSKSLLRLEKIGLIQSIGCNPNRVYYAKIPRNEYMTQFDSTFDLNPMVSAKPLSYYPTKKNTIQVQFNNIDRLRHLSKKINSGNNKTNALSTHVSDELYKDFKNCCEYLDMNYSELLRIAVYIICKMVKEKKNPNKREVLISDDFK